jgi:hypothetical protein
LIESSQPKQLQEIRRVRTDFKPSSFKTLVDLFFAAATSFDHQESLVAVSKNSLARCT